MRKTTIFRSSQLAVLSSQLAVLGAVLVLPVNARAQDSLQIAGATDEHMVVEGETLWGLAELYLGDPFLWPEIYRLNTHVVEDPHWIFPGEVLQLAQGDSLVVVTTTPITGDPGVAPTPEVTLGQRPEPPPVAEVDMPEAPVSPGVPPPPPPTEDVPTVFAQRARRTGTLGAMRSTALYRPVRRGEFYAAGFLSEQQQLPWGKVLGAAGTPTLSNLTSSSSAMVYGEIVIEPPPGATYQIGDSLLVAIRGREVPNWGRVIRPTGIARVVEWTSDGRVLAEIIVQFNRIADGQFAMPLEPFFDPGDVVPVPIANGVRGSIIVRRDKNPVAGQQDIVFIDLGRSSGVTLGDIFVVLRDSGQHGSSDTVAMMHVVHVRERSASALLTFINSLGVVADAPVQLFRKMPS